MASQPFYQIDTLPTPVAPVRTTFSNGIAAGAVQRALASVSSGVANATLDEIAQAVEANTPRELLTMRNAIMSRLFECPAPDDDAMRDLCDTRRRIEDAILKHTPVTAEAAVMKMIALLQLTAGGQVVQDVEAARAIVEARRFFGVGYVYPPVLNELPAAVVSPPDAIALPEGYDRFMHGPYVAWLKAYDAYMAAKVERVIHETSLLTPVSDRWDAVRDQWPDDYDFAADPTANAVLEAIGLDEVQAQFDDLSLVEHDAQVHLLTIAAPGPAELAIKLKLFREAQGWYFKYAGDVIGSITADARRFGRHGAFLETDHKLLKAFAARRREAEFWLSERDEVATFEEEEASEERTAVAESQIWSSGATTIEGVIIKLRTLFPQLCAEDWGDRALTDPTHGAFKDGLAKAPRNDQVLWSAITDLARVGGVDLAVQGA